MSSLLDPLARRFTTHLIAHNLRTLGYHFHDQSIILVSLEIHLGYYTVEQIQSEIRIGGIKCLPNNINFTRYIGTCSAHNNNIMRKLI